MKTVFALTFICLLANVQAYASDLCGKINQRSDTFFIVGPQGESCEVSTSDAGIIEVLINSKTKICLSGYVFNDEDKGCVIFPSAVTQN